MRFFSTEIDGSGRALVFWIFGQDRAFTRISSFSGFFKVFPNFSMLLKVLSMFFQDVSGFLTLNSDEGPGDLFTA